MKLLSIFILVSLSSFASVVEHARLAKLAYEDSPKAHLGALLKHENENYGNRMLVFKDDLQKKIYVSVRGTVQLENWISNTHIGASDMVVDSLVSFLVPQDYQQHYKAFKQNSQDWFLGAFKDLLRAVQPALKTYSDYQFVFVGHSYGGLMASLLAQDTFHRYPEIDITCEVFGAPGTKNIRRETLKLPSLPKNVLEKRFRNHVRWTDPVGMVGDHEGQVLKYEANSEGGVLGQHIITPLVEDLARGMQPRPLLG